MWLLLVSCTAPPTPAPVADPLPADVPTVSRAFARLSGEPVRLRARELVVASGGLELRFDAIDARLEPVGDVVDLTDPRTFRVEVDAVVVRIPEGTLHGGLSLPGGDPSPFHELTLRTGGDALEITGTARLLRLPFEFRAVPSVTDDGRLALELESVKALGLGVRKFVGHFERPVEKKIAEGRRSFLYADRDLLLVDPFPWAGPPGVDAEFSSLVVTEHGLVATLGEPAADLGDLRGLQLSGGLVGVEGSVMYDTTLSLPAPDDGPLVIDPERFSRQLREGRVELTAKGLTTVFLAPLEALDRG